MLRFSINDLPNPLQEQVRRKLACQTSSAMPTACHADHKKGQRKKKIRPPITMTRKNEQSATERQFNAEFLNGMGRFEAITLNLPGGVRYTPDFLFKDPRSQTDAIILFEVKGSYRLFSQARAASVFKTACELYPEFIFAWAEQQRGNHQWKLAFFNPKENKNYCFQGTAAEILNEITNHSCSEEK